MASPDLTAEEILEQLHQALGWGGVTWPTPTRALTAALHQVQLTRQALRVIRGIIDMLEDARDDAA